jgi:protein phosphatase/serine/threonine-protein phosphatase Stp1
MTNPIETGAARAGRFRSWFATHQGTRRSHNEDAYVHRPELGLWAVADGAGGHQAGDVASRTIAAALNAIPADLAGEDLLTEVRNRIAQARIALCAVAAAREGHAVLASTIVALLTSDQHFACLWAGDSRIYLLRDGVLVQATRDHSLVQELVESGRITPAEAEKHPRANVITRAISSDSESELEKVTERLWPGDRFLLCSDGVNKALPESELAMHLADATQPAERLIEAALARRATDNVTAVVVDVSAA